VSFRDCTGAKEVLSFDDLTAWVMLPSVVLWQHIHTKYVQVPEHIGSEVVARASLQDLRAYREFVRAGKTPSVRCHLIKSLAQLLPPRTRNHPMFELDDALRWVDPGHFWAFKTYGAQGSDTSGRCSYCEFHRAFKRLEELEKKYRRRESRAGRSGFFKLVFSHVGTPTKTPNQKTREVAVAC
jgi:hypothetical protein